MILRCGACIYFVNSNRQRGHKDLVALLIDRGAVVDKTDMFGYTPLFRAAQVCNFERYIFLFRCFVLLTESDCFVTVCNLGM